MAHVEIIFIIHGDVWAADPRAFKWTLHQANIIQIIICSEAVAQIPQLCLIPANEAEFILGAASSEGHDFCLDRNFVFTNNVLSSWPFTNLHVFSLCGIIYVDSLEMEPELCFCSSANPPKSNRGERTSVLCCFQTHHYYIDTGHQTKRFERNKELSSFLCKYCLQLVQLIFN